MPILRNAVSHVLHCATDSHVLRHFCDDWRHIPTVINIHHRFKYAAQDSRTTVCQLLTISDIPSITEISARSLGLHETAEILLSIRKYLGWNNPSGSLIKKKGNVPFKAKIAFLKHGQIIHETQWPFRARGVIARFPCTLWTLFSLKFYYMFKYTLLVIPSAWTYDRLKGSTYSRNCWTFSWRDLDSESFPF